MESSKTIRRARTLMVLGLGAAALWFGSQVMVATPRAHAQDDTSVSGDNSAATNDVPDDASPDASKTPPNIAGSWTGTAEDKRHGEGTLSLTFTQATKAVAVTIWEVTYADDSSAGGTGAGKLNGDSLKLVLSDPTISDKCTVDASGKVHVTDGVADEIVGTYSLKKCFVKNSTGTFDLTPAATPTPTPS
jgi:hypothetical protein